MGRSPTTTRRMAREICREIILFGIRFLDGSFEEIREELDRGGVMVVPAAPALATIYRDEHYYAALKQSRFAILDSGLLCCCWRSRGFP